MKKIILKICVVISCVCIIIGSCCSVFAISEEEQEMFFWWKEESSFDVNTYNHVLSPTTCFTYTRSGYNGLVSTYSDSTPNFTQDGVSFFYSSQDKGARPIDKISIMTNIGSGFTFRKGVSYKMRFKLVIPKSYAPGQSVGSMWHSTNYKIGFYTWASPQFDAVPNICTLQCVQLDKQPSNTLLDYDLNLDPFYVPRDKISYDLVYFDMTANFIPSRDFTAKAFGMTFSGYFSAWYGQIGLGDFYISMNSDFSPHDTPNLDYSGSNAMEDLEQDLLDNSFIAGLDNNYGTIIGSLDLFNFAGLEAVTHIFNKAINTDNMLQNIFMISLALGITGFIISTAQLIYNKSVRENVKNNKNKDK